MPLNLPLFILFPANNFPAAQISRICFIFARCKIFLSFRAGFSGTLQARRCAFLQQKAQLCALDQKNTPVKGGEIPLRPVKICLLNARSMHMNTRYTEINRTN